VNGRIFVFGGENSPRNPIDNTLHAFDPETKHWSVVASSSSNESETPVARVGHSAAGLNDKMYVFGGRTGVSQQETSLGDFWEFDVPSSRWAKTTAASAPAARSYHVMAANKSRVFVFGGCGAEGRLNDLHSFDPRAGSWHLHASNGDAPSIRGGPALFATEDKVYVYGGFNGSELGDFYSYDLSSSVWSRLEIEGSPLPRSVACACTLADGRLFLFGGEVDPSTQGHAGAGDYTNETWLFDPAKSKWEKAPAGEQDPSPRGWLAGSAIGNDVYLFGGFDGKERTNDHFIWTAS